MSTDAAKDDSPVYLQVLPSAVQWFDAIQVFPSGFSPFSHLKLVALGREPGQVQGGERGGGADSLCVVEQEEQRSTETLPALLVGCAALCV